MLIALNKPFNVLCQFTDRSVPPRRTLAEFGLPADVYAAGRLDYDSEGLLLLTDDGALANRITDPRHKQAKTYWVQVEGEPRPEQLSALRQGVVLNDGITLPAQARALETAPALWPRDPPVRFRKTRAGCVDRTHDQRRPQPPGAAHDRGGRLADAAAGAGFGGRTCAGRTAARPMEGPG